MNPLLMHPLILAFCCIGLVGVITAFYEYETNDAGARFVLFIAGISFTLANGIYVIVR